MALQSVDMIEVGLRSETVRPDVPTAPPPPSGRRPSTPVDIRWTAFMYGMPSRPTRHRVALWRELHRLGALNLLHATWALPYGEAGPPDITSLHAIVDAAGGTASSGEVSAHGAFDADLSRRLVHACEQLWDGFFNRVDELVWADDDILLLDSDARPSVSELRRQYVDLLGQDVVMSRAALRAARRLDRLSARDHARDGDGNARIPVEERAVRHRVALAGRPVGLNDGAVRYVVRIDPSPTLAWERGLVDFEAAVYRPDPVRAPFRHGATVFIASSSGRQALVDALAGRLRRFEQSLV